MLSKLLRWARITKAGTDDQQFAVQQMEYLGKVADGLIVFPYGLHGNVPADALALMFSIQGAPDNRAAIAWTPKDRPKLAAGEVAFYHPPTDAFIIWRASGDLDIETGNSGGANVNINCATANVTASDSINFDTPLATFTGDVEIAGTSTADDHISDSIGFLGHSHEQGDDTGGDTEQDTGPPKWAE